MLCSKSIFCTRRCFIILSTRQLWFTLFFVHRDETSFPLEEAHILFKAIIAAGQPIFVACWAKRILMHPYNNNNKRDCRAHCHPYIRINCLLETYSCVLCILFLAQHHTRILCVPQIFYGDERGQYGNHEPALACF